MNAKQRRATFFAFLAAVLYAINSPFSKLLLDRISTTMMAAFLYLGAGIGLFIIGIIQDSLETAINSSGDVIFAATAEFMDWQKEGKELPF